MLTEGEYYKLIPYPDSTQLLLIFSSVDTPPGKFTLYRSTHELPLHLLYLNDKSNGWYQSGVPGLGNSIDDTIQAIEGLKSELGAKEIFTVGSSMGAYAAILYGLKLKAHVLAFGPEIVLRLPGSRTLIYMPKESPVYVNDLRPLISSSQQPIIVYAGEADPSDLLAAYHLYGFPNVECVTVRAVAHKTPLFLERKIGISKIIQSFIDGNPVLDFPERGKLSEHARAIELILSATNAMASKQWHSAITGLKEVLQLCPSSDLAHHKLGISLYQLGDYASAADHQTAAIEISPHYANAYHQLGICLRKLGHYFDSYEAHKRAYELEPDMAAAYHHAGLSLEKLERWHEAETAFRKALSLDKGNANYTKKMAEFLQELAIKRLKESEKLLLSLLH